MNTFGGCELKVSIETSCYERSNFFDGNALTDEDVLPQYTVQKQDHGRQQNTGHEKVCEQL